MQWGNTLLKRIRQLLQVHFWGGHYRFFRFCRIWTRMNSSSEIAGNKPWDQGNWRFYTIFSIKSDPIWWEEPNCTKKERRKRKVWGKNFFSHVLDASYGILNSQVRSTAKAARIKSIAIAASNGPYSWYSTNFGCSTVVFSNWLISSMAALKPSASSAWK